MQTRWELAHKRVCIISPAYGASRHREEAEGGIEVSVAGWRKLFLKLLCPFYWTLSFPYPHGKE